MIRKELHFPRSEVADREVKSNLSSAVANIFPQEFISTVSAARRIANIYTETDPTFIPPAHIIQEAYYLDQPMLEKQQVEKNLSHISALHFAVDPLTIRHAISTKVRLNGRIEWEEIVEFARKKALHTLSWNLNLNLLSQLPKAKWIEEIPKLISSNLEYLLENIVREYQDTVPLDSISSLLADSIHKLPEEIVIQKQEIEELLKLINSLPFPIRQTTYHLITHLDGMGEKQKELARKTLAKALGKEELLESKKRNTNHQVPSQSKGMADSSGLSIFQGLDLGQVFWIITKLPLHQQLAVYYKLGYLETDDPIKYHGYTGEHTIRRHRASAKVKILKIRNEMKDTTPYLQETLLPFLIKAKTHKASRFANGTVVRPTSKARFTILKAIQEDGKIINYLDLSTQQQSVVKLILKGASTQEIASALNISAKTVSSYISTAARRMTSQVEVKTLADGKLIPKQSSARFAILKALERQQEKIEFLTQREQEIVRLIVDGLSTEDVARKLNIAVGTVFSYISIIARKLNGAELKHNQN